MTTSCMWNQSNRIFTFLAKYGINQNQSLLIYFLFITVAIAGLLSTSCAPQKNKIKPPGVGTRMFPAKKNLERKPPGVGTHARTIMPQNRLA
jgi:hypothetical protein